MWNFINSDYFTNKAFVVMHVPGKHGLFGAISLEVTSLTIAVSQPFCFGWGILEYSCLPHINVSLCQMQRYEKIDFIYGMNCDELLGSCLIFIHLQLPNHHCKTRKTCHPRVSGFLQVQLYRSLEFRLGFANSFINSLIWGSARTL